MYNNKSIKTASDEQKPLADEQEIILELEAQQAAAVQGNSQGSDTEGSSSDGDQKGGGWKNFWGKG